MLDNTTEKITSYPNSNTNPACIQTIFEEQVKKTPNATAVFFAGQTLSYRELNERANQLAHYLQKLGIETDEPIAFWVERSLEAIIGFLGILKAGAAYLPIDPCYPEERQLEMLKNATAKVGLVVSNIHVHSGEIPLLQLDCQKFAQESTENLKVSVTQEQLAYVMYTSGSTGKPKAIAIPHRGVVRLVKQPNYVKLTSQEQILQLSPLTFDASTLEIWGSLLNGARLVIMPPHTPSLAEIGAAISQHQVTTLWLTAGLFQLMVEEQLEDLKPIKQLLAGGDVLSLTHVQQVLEKLEGCQLINGYGPTENTTFTCCFPVTSTSKLEQSVPIGKPISHTQVYILDSNMKPVSVGEVGELYTGGEGLARGYLNNPELTAEKFVPNPFSEKAGDRLYRTGDQGRFLPDGNIEFLGRIDAQVKISGFRIEPGEVENILNQHPLVRNSLVTAKEISKSDRRLIAYVVPHDEPEQRPESETEQGSQYLVHWEGIYDDLYRETPATDDPTFNIIGWNSSYTGEPIPPVEMAEWLQATVSRILNLGSRQVLEIGCGTGMLLFKIAPTCSRYVGTDLSQSALDYVTQHLELAGNQAEIDLMHRMADNFDGFESNSFDLLFFNSVSQHFPTMDYLLDVMEKAVTVVAPGGYIFLGDVRCHPLLSAFHSSVQLYQSPDELTVEQWQQRVANKIAIEDQLVIDPAFFVDLKTHLPKISHVQVLLKRDNSVKGNPRSYNELTKFRYDVIIYIGQQKTPVQSEWLSWQEDNLSLENIQQRLRTENHQVLCIKDIPNSRVIEDLKIAELAHQENHCATVQEIRELAATLAAQEKAVDPEDLCLLGEKHSYTVHVSWSGGDRPGCYDIAFVPNTHPEKDCIGFPFSLAETPIKPADVYANHPYRPEVSSALVPELKAYLEEKLPDYMLPSSLIAIPTFPLTNNGKIDRQQLPLPEDISSPTNGSYVAPQNQTEESLGELFGQVLRRKQIGRQDNFFDLGGNSLLAMQVVSRIRDQFQIEVKLKQFFANPTPSHLAEIVELNQGKIKVFQKVIGTTGSNYEEGEI
ncbi:MAG: amino acid adenylation domain-containing protein [Symploca sp. SIO3E6]|nr:amino acid adenylation domain-containing protein [Caldora sp. SIO3E6]